jgi:hypothetical protein
MIRVAAFILMASSLAGCGLVETAGSAATEATAQAQQLQQAKATEARARAELAAAAQTAAQRREDGEKEAQ